MGLVLSSESDKDENGSGEAKAPVLLNVYDLTNQNSFMYWCGVGIYHSGIEAHGLEYGYGAHEYPTSGVFEVEPKSCPGFKYRCTIVLGYVNMAPSEFRAFMESIVGDYYGDMYHLVYKNCNHFSDDICCRLTGKRIPAWINRLANIGAVCSCLLPESLQLPAIKQPLEYHLGSEDGSESLSIISAQESYDTDQDRRLSPPPSGGDVAFIQEARR